MKKPKLRNALENHLKAESKINKRAPAQPKKAPLKHKNNNLLNVHVWKDSRGKVLHASLTPFHPQLSRVLLVGEGDFGFAGCLLERYGIKQVIATGFDSEALAAEKYAQYSSNATYLKKHLHTGSVLMDVDCRHLDTNKQLKAAIKQHWHGSMPTRVVFNFPHTGQGIKDRARNIHAQQQLLKDFFAAVVRMYSDCSVPSKDYFEMSTVTMAPEGAAKATSDPHYLNKNIEDEGEEGDEDFSNVSMEEQVLVCVTIKQGDPYDDWDIKRLAPRESLRFLTSFAFESQDANQPLYAPIYAHARTLGDIHNEEDDFEARGRTYVWQLIASGQEG